MELRAQYEAAEAREAEKVQSGDDTEAVEEEASDDGDEEKAPKARKKKAPAEPKVKRTRTAKVVRQRVVWVVFDNSHKEVQTFDYPRKQEAVDLAERLKSEKKSTYFVQPVKVDIKD